MHFSILDTHEYAEATGTIYTGYNIYINGSYHCCLRYKQLHAFHEQLRRRSVGLGLQLPAFPPKRLLPLTSSQVETRRAALEHYLQLIGQDVKVAKLELFQNFLLNAQRETASTEGVLLESVGTNEAKDVSLQVILMNGYQLDINCRIEDNATAVLQRVCQNVRLLSHFVRYFCLFLVRKEAKNTLVMLRRLMDFESPYLAQLYGQPCQILLRKSYWNSIYDLRLMQDPTALNLLYIQTVSEVELEWLILTPEFCEKLCSLQKHGLKKEYLEIVRQLPLYGCLQFSPVLIDYPEPQTSALISIGNNELSMRKRSAKGAKIHETKFRVTRMRCWRVTAMHNTVESKDVPSNLQISFEYLMSKQSLRWITITSTQAMLMSVCLQSMVDELLNCKDTKSICGKLESSIPSYSKGTSYSHTYTTRNTSCLSSDQTSISSSTTAPVKFLSESRRQRNTNAPFSYSYSAVFFRNAQNPVHNEAFEDIGDDDL